MGTIDRPVFYRIVGEDNIAELKPRRVWSRVDGMTTERRFTGPANRIQDYFNELSADPANNGADEIGESYNGASGELTIRVVDDSGGDDGGATLELNSVWEINDIEELKPIETHSDFNALTAKQKADIIDAVRNAQTNPVEGTAATTLYAYLSHQVLDYPVIYKELRRSIAISDRNTLELSTADAGKVVSLPFDAPTKYLPTNWEWLYKGAQRRQVSRTRYSLSQTWIGADKWAKILGGTWEPTS